MSEQNISSHLSIEIDLLFDNKKLDTLKYLGILYQVKIKRKNSKLNVEELLYYYTMLYYETNNIKTPLIYKYLRDKKRINELIIYLENLKFIQVHGDVTSRLNRLQLSITECGVQAVESLQSDSTLKYFEYTSHIIEKYPYRNKNSEFQNLLYIGEF
ncbi:hypothetical protein [Mammaliicoccus sciuri]|uniref:hypothetical protein n=1 Tax=Mammaliicoccus sciuri TaxID=1296 RepID=UPI002DB9EBEE|nr:hypothetical protein [Mammaliicoccus sciuri]MEB7051425.1 hypothetical protein [Mammaliicoccus sciuri]